VLAYALGKVPAGIIADKFGGRKNFLGGMAGSVLFTLLFILGGGLPIFTIAWIGNRLVQSAGWVGLVKVTSRWFSYSAYGSVMAVLSLSYLFGDAVSREVMSLLLEHGLGWRGLFVTGAALLGALLLLNVIFLRESPTEYNLAAAVENPRNLFANRETEQRQSSTATVIRGLFSSRAFWLVCLLSLGTTLLRETFNLWTPTYFTQFAGMTTAKAASGSALFPLFGGFSVLLAGFLSDFFGPAGRSRILFGGLCCTVVVLFGLAFSPAHAPQWLLLSLVGLAAFMLIGPYSYLAGAMSLDFGGKDGGATASGVIDSAGYLAGALSGNGMAYIVVSLGWKAFFLVLAAVAALSAITAIALLWQQCRAKAA
jgi:sugar phosphate permease